MQQTSTNVSMNMNMIGWKSNIMRIVQEIKIWPYYQILLDFEI